MSHFYGTVQGNRGEATRGGSKNSGMDTATASWEGSVQVHGHGIMKRKVKIGLLFLFVHGKVLVIMFNYIEARFLEKMHKNMFNTRKQNETYCKKM